MSENYNTASQLLILEVNTGRGNKLISITDLQYIKAANKCTIIFFDDFSNIKTNHLLKWFVFILPKPEFIRCHNSFIVNCQRVDYYCSNEIILKRMVRIPLSRNKKQHFKKSYNLFFRKKIIQKLENKDIHAEFSPNTLI